MAENNKLKILYILEIMKKTDEVHPLNATQIAEKLQSYGIKAERKSIVRAVECLNNAGYEIRKCENHNLGWYMIGQEFEDYELKMLADAVASAKFLTMPDSRRLIKKIRQLATVEGERLIDATLIMDPELKINDPKFKLKFDMVIRAITGRRQLRFQYYEYAQGNRKILKRNGHVYQVSPYFIALSNEEYFLIANPSTHDHVTHFRIEMLTGLEIYDMPVRPMNEIEELKEIGKGRSIADYIRESVNMWNGESTRVVLRVANGCRHELLLKFGRSISIHDDEDDGYLIAHIQVANSRGFYFWLASYGANITILSPENMRVEFRDFMQNTLRNYE